MSVLTCLAASPCSNNARWEYLIKTGWKSQGFLWFWPCRLVQMWLHVELSDWSLSLKLCVSLSLPSIQLYVNIHLILSFIVRHFAYGTFFLTLSALKACVKVWGSFLQPIQTHLLTSFRNYFSQIYRVQHLGNTGKHSTVFLWEKGILASNAFMDPAVQTGFWMLIFLFYLRSSVRWHPSWSVESKEIDIFTPTK